MIKSHEAVLTHQTRYNLQLTPAELFDLRLMLISLRDSNCSNIKMYYSNIISNIIIATDTNE